MTIDDDNSIYVGGLPYDATEESVRRAFDLYGAVVAVKIINDRHIGGKCYGFVTFTNPRSAIDAINDMDGRTIGGRVVKVNEVRTRGGRPGHMHERFRENERDMDWNRDRDRGRFQDHDRDHYRDRNNDRSRERDHDHRRDDRKRDRDPEQVRDQESNRIYDRDWQRDHDADWDQDRSIERVKDYERNDVKSTEERLNDRFGSNFAERRTRERSISSDESPKQVKDKLEAAVQRRDDLQSEIVVSRISCLCMSCPWRYTCLTLYCWYLKCLGAIWTFSRSNQLDMWDSIKCYHLTIAEIDEKLESKQLLVADLEEKSQKLEDSLASAKKLFFYRDMQLMKLQKCFIQVKDCKERLKSYEQELQALVDTAMIESDDVATAPARDVSV